MAKQRRRGRNSTRAQYVRTRDLPPPPAAPILRAALTIGKGQYRVLEMSEKDADLIERAMDRDRMADMLLTIQEVTSGATGTHPHDDMTATITERVQALGKAATPEGMEVVNAMNRIHAIHTSLMVARAADSPAPPSVAAFRAAKDALTGEAAKKMTRPRKIGLPTIAAGASEVDLARATGWMTTAMSPAVSRFHNGAALDPPRTATATWLDAISEAIPNGVFWGLVGFVSTAGTWKVRALAAGSAAALGFAEEMLDQLPDEWKPAFTAFIE